MKAKYIGDFTPPQIQTDGSAGLDLFNNLHEDVVIKARSQGKLSTGFYIEIPNGYVGIVAVRSSIGFKKNAILSNGIGVIDSDYRGEVKVAITNNSDEDLVIKPGERVAQLLVVPCLPMNIEYVDELSETERGDNGIGSTGTKVEKVGK